MLCYDPMEEESLVDVCISSMLYENHLYLENLLISSFIRLVKASKRISMSVRNPSKGSTSQTPYTIKQPWRRKGKKVEVDVVEESKKATKGKKRERHSIPLPLLFQLKNCIVS